MKVGIPHSQTPPTNDLFNLPDINGVFNEVKGPSALQSSQTVPQAVQPNIHKSDDSQQLFRQYAQRYGYRVKRYDRKNYEIDSKVVGLLKPYDINNMSITDIVNAVLRAFIGTNNGYLKEFLHSNDYIVNNLQNHAQAKYYLDHVCDGLPYQPLQGDEQYRFSWTFGYFSELPTAEVVWVGSI